MSKETRDEQAVTAADVAEMVQAVRDVADDPETAHGREDLVWLAVLHAIAGGTADDPAACAREAVMTITVDFPRWYA